MISFLKGHFRYHTMNVWNQSTSYANNVKLYNLGLTKEQTEQAYRLLDRDLDQTELNENIRLQIIEFEKATGYVMVFNGHSSGYLVLYDTTYDQKIGTRAVYPGRSIDKDEDFEGEDEWAPEDLEERVRLVCAFDRACDNIRNLFLSYCDPECFHSETIMAPKAFYYLHRPEEEE